MLISQQYASSGYALGTVCCWGVSDFIGGDAAPRFQPFLFGGLGHLAGTVFVGTLAIAGHEAVPPASHLAWAALAGACGGSALGLFYRALSQGNLGRAAAAPS